MEIASVIRAAVMNVRSLRVFTFLAEPGPCLAFTRYTHAKVKGLDLLGTLLEKEPVMLSKIASLFSRQALKRRSRSPCGAGPRTASSGVSKPEGRDVPSYLTFGTAYVAGAVSAANSLAASSIYLPSYGSANGNLASRTTSSVGQATSSINYSNNFTDTVELDLQSSINTGNYTSGNARTNTTPNNNVLRVSSL